MDFDWELWSDTLRHYAREGRSIEAWRKGDDVHPADLPEKNMVRIFGPSHHILLDACEPVRLEVLSRLRTNFINRAKELSEKPITTAQDIWNDLSEYEWWLKADNPSPRKVAEDLHYYAYEVLGRYEDRDLTEQELIGVAVRTIAILSGSRIKPAAWDRASLTFWTELQATLTEYGATHPGGLDTYKKAPDQGGYDYEILHLVLPALRLLENDRSCLRLEKGNSVEAALTRFVPLYKEGYYKEVEEPAFDDYDEDDRYNITEEELEESTKLMEKMRERFDREHKEQAQRLHDFAGLLAVSEYPLDRFKQHLKEILQKDPTFARQA